MRHLGKRWPKTTSVSVLGVDTNVLVRFVTRDDPMQSPQSRDLITRDVNQPIYVNLIALVELVWVLSKVKRLPLDVIYGACRGFLENETFRVERADLARLAIDAAERAGCDLADALIALTNAEAGCQTTATFDVDAQSLDLMVPVEDRI